MSRIVGVGTDIVALARIEGVLAQHGARFLERVLTPGERTARNWVAADAAAALARRWALKEAVAKALGTGIGGQLSFQDIDVTHTLTGAPEVRVRGFAGAAFQVSVSDDRQAGAAVAFCVAVAL